jgi:hypothetical protein
MKYLLQVWQEKLKKSQKTKKRLVSRGNGLQRTLILPNSLRHSKFSAISGDSIMDERKGTLPRSLIRGAPHLRSLFGSNVSACFPV